MLSAQLHIKSCIQLQRNMTDTTWLYETKEKKWPSPYWCNVAIIYSLVWCDEKNFTSVIFFPSTNVRKSSGKSTFESIVQYTSPVPFGNVTKKKTRKLKNCHKTEEIWKTWWLNVMWYLDWIQDQKDDINGEGKTNKQTTDEIQ